MADDKPVIIIKKGGGHGGHHGGAWKVAYADFVTAMMAFFMVMWLVNTVDSSTRKNIAHFFANPGVFTDGSGTPIFSGGSGILPEGAVPPHPERTNFNFGRSQDPRTGSSDEQGGQKRELRFDQSIGIDDRGAGKERGYSNVKLPETRVLPEEVTGLVGDGQGVTEFDAGAGESTALGSGAASETPDAGDSGGQRSQAGVGEHDAIGVGGVAVSPDAGHQVGTGGAERIGDGGPASSVTQGGTRVGLGEQQTPGRGTHGGILPAGGDGRAGGEGGNAQADGISQPPGTGQAQRAPLRELPTSRGGTNTEVGAISPQLFERARAFERRNIERAAEEIRQQIASSPEMSALVGVVDVKVDADGLNIEIMDTERSSMFSSGSARILPEARTAFEKLGEILKPLPNNIDIVGHTDAVPFSSGTGGYSNWELSADRANAARRLLEREGIASSRFTSVVGRADQELRLPESPRDPSNRRITLRMRFMPPERVALSKDPTALQDLPRREREFQERQRPREPVHSFSPREVIEPRQAPAKPLPLPDPQATVTPPETPSAENLPIMPQDLIFNDTPVFGSNALFD